MIWVFWLFDQVSYRIRPFDMVADQRRWFWQSAQKCGGCWVFEGDD